MFTSSGLGDALVEAPRRALFDEWFVGVKLENQLERQDAFHRHQWPDRPELSVCMSRIDARTVSYTVVDLEADRATMTYYPDAPDRPVAPVQWSLAAHLPT
jgi:hypothetical protein